MTSERFVDRSAVEKARLYHPRVSLAERRYAFPLFAVASLGGLALYFYLAEVLPDVLLWIYCGTFAVASIALITAYLIGGFQRHQEIKRARHLLKDAIEELSFNTNRLSEYLDDLDRRTSQYFNSVTQSKARHYFLLKCFESSLLVLLEDLRRAMTSRNPAKLLSALDQIRGHLPPNAAMAAIGEDSANLPSLHDLPRVISIVIRELEQALEEIEAEVKAFQRETGSGTFKLPPDLP